MISDFQADLTELGARPGAHAVVTSVHVRREPGFLDLITTQGAKAAHQVVVAGFGEQPEVNLLF